MQIGNKVWLFDSNHRVYKDAEGNKTTSPLYRGYFVEKYIVGETKQSWLVGYKGNTPDDRLNIKVNKKTLTYIRSNAFDGRLYTSEEQIDQLCWINENRHKLSQKINQSNDYQKLKEIEAILNRE